MKRLLIGFMVMCCLLPLRAQKIKTSDVPENILKIYTTKLSDTVPAKWIKENDLYTAAFVKNKLHGSMVINERAEWVETQWELPVNYLPKKVREHMYANFQRQKIKYAAIVFRPGSEYYLVSLKKKKAPVRYKYSIKAEYIGTDPPEASSKE